MKFIYKILVLGMVCLISSSTHAQIQQYSDDGTDSCIDCEAKNSSNSSKNCTCDFIEDYDVAFTIYARLEAQRQAAWLNERQTAIKEELDKRYNTTFNNFADAQHALFKDMVKAFDESKSIVEAVKNDASFDLQNDSREFRKYFYEKGALRQRLNEIGDGVNGDLSVVGDLKTDGRLIKNMSSIDLNNRLMTIGGNETNTFNLIERNGRILDGLPKIGNTSISDTKIINAYIDDYNSKNVENKVRAMLKYMIRNNLGSPFNNSWYVDDTNLFHPTRSYLAREYSDLAYHQGEYTYPTESISDEERINRYAISQFGNQALDLILSTSHLKLRVGDYLKYHRYEESTMNFATDIFKHYGDGRFHNFPHNQYDYSLDDGSLYSIDLQDEQNKNRLFLMHNHNAGRTRKFNGLGNVLSGLAALEGADRDEAFIGDFALEILKDNGYDMSTMFTGQQAFDLFSFRTTTYGNLGRYDLRIDIGKFRGEYLWDNNIRFPSYIGDLIARDAILAYAANDHARFEHLLRVRSIANSLNFDNLQANWLIDHPTETGLIFGYLDINNANNEAFAREAYDALRSGGTVDFVDEVIFDSSFVHSKGKCVFDYIKQTNGSLFRNTIRNFIDNKEYDLRMIVEPLKDANELSTAITSDELINQGIISIKFNSKIVNTINSLDWATTILHEGIHAELYRFVHKNDPTVKPIERARIIQLYLFYKKIGYNGDIVDTFVQHTHMTQKYVVPIAKALRELDKNQYPLDDYMYLAWEDLLGDEIAEELKPSEEQLSIWLDKSIKIRDKNNIPCK